MEYRLKTGTAPMPDGFAIALVPEGVRVVAKHFAIRTSLLPHDAGEGLFFESYILDHMPTGLRAFGGSVWDPKTEEECEAFALALARMDHDWSANSEDLPSGDALKPAFEAALIAGEQARQASGGGEP